MRTLFGRLLVLLGAVGAVACSRFPEPATEQPRLSQWVAERYGRQLAEAQIEKIICYSERLEKPVVVRQREGFHIYFAYPRGRQLAVFSVEVRDAGAVVRHDGFTEEAFQELTDNMAAVIDEALRQARTASEARERERRSG